MMNIHLYPSPFLNESRILREANSLAALGLFERIDLVGVGQTGLADEEQVQVGLRIMRVGQREGAAGLVKKASRTLGWSYAVYRRYRNAPLTCINCHSIATLPLGVLLKRATGAPIVYDAHELETEANGLHGTRKRLTKLAERALIGSVDHCIFVGDAIEKWYVRTYGLDNTTVLYNCPPRKDVPASDAFRRRFSINDATPIFLYQGVIGPGRGIRQLIEAFAGLADRAALVIMGYGPLVPWVEAQTMAHSNIHYHPAVPPQRLLAYTGAADFGLSVIEATSLSYDYCMPNKLFEYVMAGKPVIVSPTVEQRGFVERCGVGEVAAATTPEAVREAVVRMLDNGAGHYSDALERAREEFCWERQEGKLKAAYIDALGLRIRVGNQLEVEGAKQ